MKQREYIFLILILYWKYMYLKIVDEDKTCGQVVLWLWSISFMVMYVWFELIDRCGRMKLVKQYEFFFGTVVVVIVYVVEM